MARSKETDRANRYVLPVGVVRWRRTAAFLVTLFNKEWRPMSTPCRPTLAGFALLRDGRLRLRDRFLVAQIVVLDRLQVLVELIDERHAVRNIEPDDVVVRNVVEVLHERAD